MRRALGCVFATVLVLSGPAASASDVGQQIADQIDLTSYRYYLDEVLYAHDGDNRGIEGPEHDLARDNIVTTFESFGLPVERQDFWFESWLASNVIATQEGTIYPEAQYIIGAHYDSVSNPGADDNASGVAALLEIARVLSQYETELTIKYIAFDLEEWGLIGSQVYVAEHSDDDIRGMISADMIAWDLGVYTTTLYGRSASAPLKEALAAAIDEYGNGLQVVVEGPRDASDHAPFEWAGFQACVLIERGYTTNPCYHELCDSVDTPDYIDYEYAANHVRSLAGFLADHAVVIMPEPCVGDLDGDNDTDETDLGILLADWGCDDPVNGCAGDLNGDDRTDQADLGILLADWGCGT